MQLGSLLIILYTIAVVFFEFNNGASNKTDIVKKPASNKTDIAKKPASNAKQKIGTQAKPILVGGHKPWETKIPPRYQKIFNDYKNITLKKLQEIHKVPSSFVPKPDKFSTQIVGGINYLYLVKLPINKYAFISIHHRPWKKDQYKKEENVKIRSETYELNDKIV